MRQSTNASISQFIDQPLYQSPIASINHWIGIKLTMWSTKWGIPTISRELDFAQVSYFGFWFPVTGCFVIFYFLEMLMCGQRWSSWCTLSDGELNNKRHPFRFDYHCCACLPTMRFAYYCCARHPMMCLIIMIVLAIRQCATWASTLITHKHCWSVG